MRANLITLMVAAALVSACLADAQANDKICSAEEIGFPDDDIFWDNYDATTESGLPGGAEPPYATVWFKFVATTQCVDIAVTDATSKLYDYRMDTYIKLYELQTAALEGCTDPTSTPSPSDLQSSLKLIAENVYGDCQVRDGYYGLSSLYGVELTTTKTYYLAVGSNYDYDPDYDTGNGKLSVTESLICGKSQECLDDDYDGVANSEDECPNTDPNSNYGVGLLKINGCNTGIAIENEFDYETGCNIPDQLLACASDASEKKGCVNSVVKRWIVEKIITQRDAGRVKSVAADCL